ncbi:hypothetical protein HDU96_001465 [Phlyctochytrium bullatum]|nr:hypothetical protein HDU96_001465 [Phlyctochytrium bullatum]
MTAAGPSSPAGSVTSPHGSFLLHRRTSASPGFFGTSVLDQEFDPLPGPLLSNEDGYDNPFQDLLEHLETQDADDTDDDSIIVPLDIPGGGADESSSEIEVDEDDDGNGVARDDDDDDDDRSEASQEDDVDFAVNLSPRLEPTLILEPDDDDDDNADLVRDRDELRALHLDDEDDDRHLLGERLLRINERDHLFDDDGVAGSPSGPPSPDGLPGSRSSSPSRASPVSAASPNQQQQPLRRRMRFRLRRSVVPGTLAAVGAFLLLGVLWMLRRRGWALLPKLWQLAGRRWGGEL